MGLFDKLLSGASQAIQAAGSRTVRVTFEVLPTSPAEFAALPQAAMQTPFDTAALFVLAMCAYPSDKNAALEMINLLRGPKPLSQADIQFLRDRMAGRDYIPQSFLEGATPQNNYTPSQPLTVSVSENPYSYQEAGYAKLYLRSGGADNPRPIQLRQAKDGKWYLWEQYLLAQIRVPESENPWR